MPLKRHEHHGQLQKVLAEHLVQDHGLAQEYADTLDSPVILDALHRGYHLEEELHDAPRPAEVPPAAVRLRFDSVDSAVEFIEQIGYLKQTYEFAGGLQGATMLNDEWSWA